MTSIIKGTKAQEAEVVVEPAIVIRGVGKRFKLFTDRRTNLKEAFTQRRRRNRFDEFWAVKDVSFDIPRGSTFGIVGHNGSGKSTLLKLIAGIHRPTTGSIVHEGRVSALLELGAGFHPELSGRDNIYLNGAILGMSKKRINEAIDEIVEFSGLGQFIDVPVKVYSSGMYVRLGFAIAVTLDPEILIIDEIIAVGDEEFQRRCFDYLHDLRKRGVTIVFVTHSMGLVQQMCDHAAWLEHGKLKAYGSPNDVVDAYLETVNAAEAERLEAERLEVASQAPEAVSLPVGGLDGRPVTVAAEAATRRGTHEITFTSVECLDSAYRKTSVGRTGRPLTLRTHFNCTKAVNDVVFSLGIFAENGTKVSGPNSRVGGLSDIAVDGPGFIDYTLDPCPLNAGLYYVNVAAVDSTLSHVYEHWDRALEFRIQPGTGQPESGLLSLGGSWHSESVNVKQEQHEKQSEGSL